MPRFVVIGFAVVGLVVVGLLALRAGSSTGDDSTGDDSTGDDSTGEASTSTSALTSTSVLAPTTTVDPGPSRGGSLTILLAEDPTPIEGWTPWNHVCAWACRNVLDHVLETLAVTLPDGSVRPWLAESIEPDVSLKLWTVKLRPGVTFTNGEALTATVVKEGTDTFLKAGDASRSHVRDARLLTVRAIDELTLVYELSEPVGGFAATLAGPVGRVFSVVEASADENRFAAAPVGTGPYVFDRWSPGQPIVLQANPDYWMTDTDGESLPYLSQLTFRQVGDESERLALLRSGEAAVLQTRVPETISQALNSASGNTGTGNTSTGNTGTLNVINHTDDNSGAIIFNTLQPPFDDIRVRRALALAADQLQLLDSTDTEALPATQWWAPTSIWHSAAVANQWQTNSSAAAAELLNNYIASPERSDERPVGTPVQVRIQCTDDTALVELIAELEQQLEATGLVEVIAETVTRTGLIQRVIGSVADSPSFGGDFTATCWRLGGESDPWVLLDAALGPVRTSPLNIANIHTDELTALVGQLQGSFSVEDRQGVVEQIMTMLNEQVPYIYLGYSSSAVIARPEVRGIEQWHLPTGEAVQGHRLGVGRYTQVWVPGG